MALIYYRMNLIKSDILLRTCLIISGSYGAYVLGASNVANLTAVFVGAGLLTVFSAALIGGGIAAGKAGYDLLIFIAGYSGVVAGYIFSSLIGGVRRYII